MDFDGITYSRPLDYVRLSGQLLKVYELMRDGKPRTLDDIVSHAGGTVASVSARLRDLRKEKFGGHTVERRRIRDGLWTYTLKIGDFE